MISVNYAVQALHRWNGATRLIPWSEMEAYVSESSLWHGVSEDTVAPPHMVKDTLTHNYGTSDAELPPDLVQELRRRPRWLSSRLFFLEAGDCVVRDVRVWHGGCPNLSRAARYLPSIEVASRDLVARYADRDDAWPKKGLPAAHAQAMSPRARRLCTAVTAEENDGYVSEGLNAFAWVKACIIDPARRNVFLPGARLSLEQRTALSLRACLELLAEGGGGGSCTESGLGGIPSLRAETGGAKSLNALTHEQIDWLVTALGELSADEALSPIVEAPVCHNKLQIEYSTCLTDVRELAYALLDALALGPGKDFFAHETISTKGCTAGLRGSKRPHAATEAASVSFLAGRLHSLLAVTIPPDGPVQKERSERYVKRRIGVGVAAQS